MATPAGTRTCDQQLRRPVAIVSAQGEFRQFTVRSPIERIGEFSRVGMRNCPAKTALPPSRLLAALLRCRVMGSRTVLQPPGSARLAPASMLVKIVDHTTVGRLSLYRPRTPRLLSRLRRPLSRGPCTTLLPGRAHYEHCCLLVASAPGMTGCACAPKISSRKRSRPRSVKAMVCRSRFRGTGLWLHVGCQVPQRSSCPPKISTARLIVNA